MSETTIPIETIGRLFKEVAFKNADTQITRSTLELASEYIKLFVNEAVLRSNEERVLEGDSLTKVDGIDNVEFKQTQPGETQDALEEEVFDDDIDPEINEPSTQDQLGANNEYTNDTLDSRHLEKIAGILVLDF
ncbi:uncharacterized protein CANTADRAFT_5320 [Suhomyces tanzawaensis NRRL Y-17324]|uniref:Uncharacterized protein n=1 Tax=Suhomyces tanzawaensis NRRL Y-17324 TaxID=984487 RepID=A0A1E4SJC0_9ASCO|nr:uncharacterized protein CANTADRAFT_5320 [Suhomyces tanzawaensis NRRL Y-17324]ODV79588.1 hypothetical protein CANTADRAFT_5320 [Suhomyces tanzawaensis NRRL Y-17324]